MRIVSVLPVAAALALTLHPFAGATDQTKQFNLSGFSATRDSDKVQGTGTYDPLTGAIMTVSLTAGGVSESGITLKTSASSYKVGKDNATLILSSPINLTSPTGFVLNSPKGVFSGYILTIR